MRLLLIARCPDESERLHTLFTGRCPARAGPLVEVTTDRDAALAVSMGASLIGVNARDLDTLAMDSLEPPASSRAFRGVTAVHLPASSRPQQVAEVARSRARCRAGSARR